MSRTYVHTPAKFAGVSDRRWRKHFSRRASDRKELGDRGPYAYRAIRKRQARREIVEQLA